MIAFCESAREWSGVTRLMLRGAGHGRPLQAWIQATREVADTSIRRRDEALGRTPRLSYGLIATSFAFQACAVLQWWLEEEPDRSPEEVARVFRQLNMLGEGWARRLTRAEINLETGE